MKKRLAILIAVAMMFTSMPLFAFAEDEGAAPEETVTTEVTESEETDTEEDPVVDPVTVHDPGWNENHTAYYDNNGNLLKGVVVKISGKLYYFNNNGALSMSDGWKTAADGKYYVKGGTIVTAPTKIAGKKKVTKKYKYYYNKKKKKWQKKKIKGARTKIKKKKVTVDTNYLYMFGTGGKLIITKGIFTYGGKEYLGLGGGVLKTGWAAVGNKAMYFYKNSGAMAKNKKIGHLKVPKSGRLGKAYALGVRQLDKSGWTLRKAYRFSYKLRYKDRWYRKKTAEEYAIRGFEKGYGNCYVMASTFYIQAKLLGYDIHQVQGKVAHIFPHSWTVIKQNGREWVYDPNFRNETGRNGWKIWYGKKGTWRYTNYRKMN